MRSASSKPARGPVVAVLLMLLATVATAEDPPPAARPNPHDTPLGRFLGNLFEDIEKNPDAAPPQREPAEESLPKIEPQRRIVPDAIDERAIAAREQHRDFERARRLLSSGDLDAGVTLLQTLLQSHEDTLILSSTGQWESLQQRVERLIATADESIRTAYTDRFAARAQLQWNQARESGDPVLYAHVAMQYLNTPSGREAAELLSRLYRDAGEDLEADYWAARLDFDPEPGMITSAEPDVTATTPLHEWRGPFGGPTHRGVVPATAPILIERWSTQTAVRPFVAEQIQDIVRDLIDNQRACIPAAVPLAVKDRIITRTLRGLSVYDARSGRLLWESAEGVSAERLLAGEDVPRPGGESTGHPVRAISGYNGSNADAHALTALLFRDGVYGHLSSDGEQVFVLEDHATLSYRQAGYFWGQRLQDDPFDRDWDTNELVAYDLQSGHVRWRIGGEDLGEKISPPLAGTLFLGPPVVDRDELFVIGEREGTVSLHVLDRASGVPKWTHPISESGSAISHDLVRRWWPAQPAVGRGVVVCPTTTGWMVAIDRLQRRIRWTYRYLEARQKKPASNRSRVASAGPLNTRWCPSAPILTSRHVLFTPSELPDAQYGDQPRLVCLDLLTGERVWWEEKREKLYIGGVVADRVLLVGRDTVEARDIATGQRQWETPLATQAASVRQNQAPASQSLLRAVDQPSGRGIIAGDEFLLPLQSGQLWSIDIATGTVNRIVALRDDAAPLGNLIVYQGHLISVNPLNVRCFENRESIVVETATTPPRPVASQLRVAERQYLEGDFRSAHKTLSALRSADFDASQRKHADSLRWDTLVQIVRLDLQASDAEFTEMASLARTPQQRLIVERTRADRLLSRGNLQGAFDVYWKLAEDPLDVMVTEGATKVLFRRWLAGRLQTLWTSATTKHRKQFTERFEKVAAAIPQAGSRNWWSDVLRFHLVGWNLRRSIAEQAIDDRQWSVAETTLLQLIEEADGSLQFWALEQLVRVLLDRDRPADVAACMEQYADRVPGGEALRQAMADHVAAPRSPITVNWSNRPWELVRSSASFNRSMYEPILAVQSGLPSVNQLNLRVEPHLQRLSIQQLDGSESWETPLRAQSDSFYNKTTGIASVGQLLFVVHRGVLQAISVADRELRWQRSFDLRSSASGHVRSPVTARHQELRTASNFVWTSGLQKMHSPAGMLAIWRPGYVAHFGRNSFSVVDPLSGETLWTRTGIAPRTMIYGTADRLYVVPTDTADAYVLNVLDGSPVEVPHLNKLISSSVRLTPAGLLQIEERQPFRLLGWGQKTVRAQLVDPATGEELSSTTFPDQTQFATLDNGQLVAVDPDGAVSLIDADSGTSRLLGSVGEDVLEKTQRIFAVTEPGRLYLTFNKPPQPGAYSRSYQASPVQGTLAAFDLRGGMLWSEAIDDQNLIIDQLPHLPVLVMTSQRTQREEDVTSQIVHVELRNKQTGEQLLKDSRYIIGGNVRELTVDYAKQTIDLNTYKDRLRLQQQRVDTVSGE